MPTVKTSHASLNCIDIKLNCRSDINWKKKDFIFIKDNNNNIEITEFVSEVSTIIVCVSNDI